VEHCACRTKKNLRAYRFVEKEELERGGKRTGSRFVVQGLGSGAVNSRVEKSGTRSCGFRGGQWSWVLGVTQIKLHQMLTRWVGMGQEMFDVARGVRVGSKRAWTGVQDQRSETGEELMLSVCLCVLGRRRRVFFYILGSGMATDYGDFWRRQKGKESPWRTGRKGQKMHCRMLPILRKCARPVRSLASPELTGSNFCSVVAVIF